MLSFISPVKAQLTIDRPSLIPCQDIELITIKMPDLVKYLTCHSTHHKLHMYFSLPPSLIAFPRILRLASLAMNLEESEAAAPNPCVRRILREINEFRRNPHTDIEIFPSEDRSVNVTGQEA